jgi:hypothetical protein
LKADLSVLNATRFAYCEEIDHLILTTSAEQAAQLTVGSAQKLRSSI